MTHTSVWKWFVILLSAVVFSGAAGCAGGSEQTECKVDTDCPMPLACIDGVCVGNLPDAGVPDGNVNDPDGGTAGDDDTTDGGSSGGDQEACTMSSECGEFGFCVAGTCKLPYHGLRIDIENDPVEDGVLRARVYISGGIQPESIELLVDDQSFGTYIYKMAGLFRLDTYGLSDGAHELVVRLTGEEGREEYAAAGFSVRNPSLRILGFDAPEILFPGAAVEIGFEVEGDAYGVGADFSDAVPSFTQSDLEVVLGDDPLLRYQVPDMTVTQEGWRDVPIWMMGADGRTVSLDVVRMFLMPGPLFPFRNGDGRLSYHSLPPADAGAQVQVTGLRPGLSVVTGEKLEVLVDLEGEDLEHATVLFAAEGYGGHLAVPVAAMQPAGRAAGTYLAELSLPASSEPGEGDLELQAAAQDSGGKVSGKKGGGSVHHQEAGDGNLRVSLHWDVQQDIDLHVVEPGGEEIYYGYMESSNTGWLDVDGISDCEDNMGTYDEVIMWQKPPAGEFIVRVDFYRNCQNDGQPTSGSIPFKLKVKGCGEEQEVSGEIPGGTAPSGGDVGAGIEVLRFQCDGSFIVKGDLSHRYKVWNSMPQVETTGVVGGVKVEVVDESGNTLNQQETFAEEDGTYQVEFSAPEGGSDQPVSLKLISTGKVAEVTDGSKVHEYVHKETWVPKDDPAKELSVEIPLEGSEPFHIFEVVKFGHESVEGIGAGSLSKTTAVWSKSQSGSYFMPSNGQIYLQGSGDTPDEFNDVVILHELGHRIMNQLARDDTCGGNHSLRQQLAPEMAWSEGIATFLAVHFLEDNHFCWMKRTSNQCYEVDDTSNYTLGTSSGDHRGNLSEGAVTGVLFDLEDGADGANDSLSGLASSFFKAIFGDLKSTENLGAGTKDKVDLADLIFHWGCSELASQREELDDLLSGRFRLNWIEDDESTCDGMDNDCDGVIDEGAVADAHEPNQTCGAATSVVVEEGDFYANVEIDASMYTESGGADEDWYRIHLQEDTHFFGCITGGDQCFRFEINLFPEHGADDWELCVQEQGACLGSMDCSARKIGFTNGGSKLEKEIKITGKCGDDDSREMVVLVRKKNGEAGACDSYFMNLKLYEHSFDCE